MIVIKNFGLRRVLIATGHHLPWLLAWMTSVVLLYKYAALTWLSIPWLPLSLIGTAVAFYLGFKNNSAYDRMWEARKIWGAIVNSSRSWGMYVKTFVTEQFAHETVEQTELESTWRRLIYRHIGWLYTLRKQLLTPTEWEHVSQKGVIGWWARRRMKKSGLGLIQKEIDDIKVDVFFPDGEYERLQKNKNAATQIILRQAEELKELRRKGLIEDFRHMEMQAILKDFYDHQGKCERIKKFPLPRQYASISFIFVTIFIFLLPFGMVSEFAKIGTWAIWLSIPFNVIVGWIFVVMELVGDYSENPFMGLTNDIPMYSLSRTIEIDLREMLGETELPAGVASKNGVLM